MRDSNCLEQIPEDSKQDFFDTEYRSIEKLKILKQMIIDTFPVSRTRKTLMSNLIVLKHFVLSFVLVTILFYFIYLFFLQESNVINYTVDTECKGGKVTFGGLSGNTIFTKKVTLEFFVVITSLIFPKGLTVI